MRPAIAAAHDHAMQTTVHEIADGVYRLSTCVPEVAPGGFTFNQYLIDGDEPLLFHTGPRRMFPLVAEAVGKVHPDVDRLRWVSFGHVEADECGAMNAVARRRAVAPRCCSTRWAAWCRSTTSPTARRCPSPTTAPATSAATACARIVTPHVPHGWEAQVMYDETTGTLLCGDLFTQHRRRRRRIVHDADLVEPALAADDLFGATCLTPSTAPDAARAGRPGAPYAGAHARPGVRRATARGRCATSPTPTRPGFTAAGPGPMITTARDRPDHAPEARDAGRGRDRRDGRAAGATSPPRSGRGRPTARRGTSGRWPGTCWA